MKMMKKYAHTFSVLLSAAAIISSIALAFPYLPDSINNRHQFLAYADPSPANTFSKTNSGLVAQDSLTNDSRVNTDYWTLNGDAVKMNAPHSYFEDSAGLHIGIEAASSGQWAGFYAMTPKTSAQLYHAVLSIPFKTVSDHWWDTGMYIQTSSAAVNYVTCAAAVGTTGVTWQVVSTKGDTNSATQFNVLWKDTSANQPYTRDCTIITNGSNSLKVYLDNQLVYSSDTLDLQMPSPFNAYLEVQSSTISKKLFGTYTDFYSTTNQFVTVTGAPTGGKVELVASNSVLASGSVGSDGSVNLDVGKYHMPLAAQIKAYNSSGKLVASSDSLSIWAGDGYNISGNKNDNKDDNHATKDIVHSLIKTIKQDDHKLIKSLLLSSHVQNNGEHKGNDNNRQEDNSHNEVNNVLTTTKDVRGLFS